MEILGYSTREANKHANELLTQLEVNQRMDHFPHQLSGGEQQRVAIARAYAHCPQIIFADEPTGSLDTETAAKVLNSLLDINKQMNTSLIVVTHDLQIAQQMLKQYKLVGGQLVDG